MVFRLLQFSLKIALWDEMHHSCFQAKGKILSGHLIKIPCGWLSY